MKKLILVTVITACLAPGGTTGDVPIEQEPHTVSTEIASVENQPSVQSEPIHTEPPIAAEAATIAEKEEVIAEQVDIAAPKRLSAPESPPQAPADLIIEPENTAAPDNYTWVPGFGYVENGGSNVFYYAEDVYENGNKIGIMG